PRGARRRVVLPTYAFERERYTLEALSPKAASPPSATADKARVEKQSAVERSLYPPTWRRSEGAPPLVAPGSAWCVFADDDPLGRRVVERLKAAGAALNVVRPGTAFGRDGNVFTIAPERREDHDRLLRELPAQARFLHLWGVAPPRAGEGAADAVLLSVLYLAQGLGARQQTETAL